MHDPQSEIHPLDRDYSTPVESSRGESDSSHPLLLRRGVFVFIASFITVLLSSIALGNWPSGGWVESVGSVVHRLAMFSVLIGAGMILAAYRLPAAIPTHSESNHGKRAGVKRGLRTLIVANVAVYIAVIMLFYLATTLSSGTLNYLLLIWTLTLICSLMVVMIVWHQGFLRAYAIGVLIALLISVVTSVFGFNFGMWGSRGELFVAIHLGTVLVSGLVCAAYVAMLEASRAKLSAAGTRHDE